MLIYNLARTTYTIEITSTEVYNVIMSCYEIMNKHKALNAISVQAPVLQYLQALFNK